MRSSVERVSNGVRSRRVANLVEIWNRKLHFYIGLYLLLFIWLFAFTGLLLNHGRWSFAEFWPTRKQTTFEQHITPPAIGSDLTQAMSILQQLGIAGEIEWTTTEADSGHFNFRASRPGHIFEIKTDLNRQLATVQRIDVNAWGVMRVLHTFTGARSGDARNQRDWVLTTVWAWSMDAVAAGLVIMVFGSYYMWWRLIPKRLWGLVALSSGWMACTLFVLGLRLLF